MAKPTHHILVCASFRASGEARGACNRKGSVDFLPYLENEILDRGLDALVSSTGCLKECSKGPIMIIYPENHWYRQVESEETIDQILDALEEGEVAAEHLLT
ncbi:MAG TPA: (2Fe-2S) ferredoxin domain-containing protein [Anaerolineae bacterium]|nr:(2Fe-2S) ferredoxin domain-containing protein [Anaerolineae bacterium]